MLRLGRSLAGQPVKASLQYQTQRGLQGLTVGVPKETIEGEHRVALTPLHIIKLKKAGVSVSIEKNAGVGSGFSDAQYEAAGAAIVTVDDVSFQCNLAFSFKISNFSQYTYRSGNLKLLLKYDHHLYRRQLS